MSSQPSAIRAAIYCRVSTAKQGDGTSLDVQRAACEAEIEKRGWVLTDAYVDKGVSGAKASRPELDRLVAAIEAGHVDAIVVLKLDRFGRSLAHLAPTLHRFDELGVTLVSIKEDIDSSTISGRAMRAMLGLFAEMEREVIAERGVSGQRAKAEANRWPGGDAPFGYMREGQGRDVRIVQHPTESTAILLATEAILDHGRTTGDAAALLNSLGYTGRRGSPWTHQRVRRVLERESVMGVVWWGKPTRKHGHNTKMNRDGTPKYGDPIRIDLPDPLMEEERWLALQRVLKSRGYGVKADAKPYPNSGAATVCGGRIGGFHRRDRDLRQYRCNNAKWVAGNPPTCDCARVNADWLDWQVWSSVIEVLSDPNRLLSLAADYIGLRSEAKQPEAETVAQVEARIAKLERHRTEQVTEYLRAGVAADVVAEAAAKIEDEIAAARSYLAQLEAFRKDAKAETERAGALVELAKAAAERLPNMTLDEQVEVLRLLRVKVALLDNGKEPRLSIEGVVPGGNNLFASLDEDWVPTEGGVSTPTARGTHAYDLRFRVEVAA